MDINEIQITSDKSENVHSHKNVELLYILTGQIDIIIKGEVFQAFPKDVILINTEEIHSWKSHRNSLICKVYINYYELKKVLKKEHVFFACNSVKEPEKDYARIRYILETILRKYKEDPGGFWVKSLYYSLLEGLRNQYLDEIRSQDGCETVNEKAKEIIAYIQRNYNQDLNLVDMAKQWYMSESSFSRFFKREAGIGFTEYVRNVRLEHAKEELLFSNKAITDISYDCGFSNISVFNKNFKQVFELAPKEFRNNGKEKTIEGEMTESDMAGLSAYLRNAENQKKQTEQETCKICLDLENNTVFHDPVLSGMNVGFFSELLEAKTQKHVSMAIQNFGLKYIYVANPFDPALKIRYGHETERMNFEKVDAVLDFLMEQGVYPFLELSERQIKRIINISSDKMLEEIITDPVFLSLEEWERAIVALIQHFVERYTTKEVSKWMFEIWYDPEQATGVGKIPYHILYERTWRIIKDYVPEAKIGGSGLNTEMGREMLESQLCWWKERYDRPDFLAFISYPYQVEKRERLEKGNKYSLLSIDSDTHFVKQNLDAYCALLNTIEYPDTPIWLTEWNTSLSERNIYNDSCSKACHMLMQMVDAVGEIDQMNYCGISDWTAQSFDSTSPLIGSKGVITKDGLRKPAYYALEFWKSLGDCLLGKGEHYIATSQNKESVQILAFNSKQFSYGYNMKDEDSLKVGELPFIFNNNDKRELLFNLKNVRNGKHKICIYRVCESSGSILTEWGKLGYAKDLMRSEISYLEKMCIPRMEVRYVEVEQSMLNLNVTLEANEMVLIQLL